MILRSDSWIWMLWSNLSWQRGTPFLLPAGIRGRFSCHFQACKQCKHPPREGLTGAPKVPSVMLLSNHAITDKRRKIV